MARHFARARVLRTRLTFEQLEDRAVPAASITAALSDGVLTVTGTTGSDIIVLNQSTTALVSINGVATTFAASSVQSIVVDSGAGNDSVSLVNLMGWTKPIAVNNSAGTDSVRLLNNKVVTLLAANTLKINDAPPTVTLSRNNSDIAEAGGVATFTATLDYAYGLPVTVSLGFTGTGSNTTDYTRSAAQIVILEGRTSGTVTVKAVQDTRDENNETVIVDITSVTNGVESGIQQQQTTIIDDDAPPSVTLSRNLASVSEAGGVATFTATLSAVSSMPVTVFLGFSGTAVDSTDYASSASSIVIAAGSKTGTIAVTAVQDTQDENDETVIVAITGVNNGRVVSAQQQTTTIADDDAAPTVTLSLIGNPLGEAAGSATILATLSAISGLPVTVNLVLTGSATNAIDYVCSATSILIPVGSTSGTVTITALQDTLDETDETIVVDIGTVTNGTENGVQQQTTTITDDDDAPPATANDWFDANIQDLALKQLLKEGFADQALSRNEMLAVFQEAEQDGTVSTTEFDDLNALANNESLFGTFTYVADLTRNVVLGNVANAMFQGTTLGNLSANSSGANLAMLVSKWFLGADHPVANYGGTTMTYTVAAGTLFGASGPQYSDVRQGSVGDCYLVGTLAEIAQESSQTITSMFIVNGDGTYTVRFYNAGQARYVTVDSQLPTYGGGYFLYANMGERADDASNVLWVALAEKAYVQMNEAGWLRSASSGGGVNSYQAIAGGWFTNVTAQVANRRGTTYSVGSGINVTTFESAFNAGKMIGFGSVSSPTNASVVGNHQYIVTAYNAETKMVTLFNPWGLNNGTSKPGLIELSLSELSTSFNYWATA